MKNALVSFIKAHPHDWEMLLKADPYYLEIKTDDNYPYLYCFSYNQIKSDFSSDIVQCSRGIILYIKDNIVDIVCWAFNKFFNYNEPHASSIDWNSAVVQEKIDGSIIKLHYNKYYNKWIWSTNSIIDAHNSTLGSEGSKYITFHDLIDEVTKEWKYAFDPHYTYIFEIVSPFNRIVVPYDTLNIYHIGTRNNMTGEELSIDIGIKKPQIYSFSTWENMIESIKTLPFSKEGYVVVDKYWNRVKVKSLEYLKVHHLRHNGELKEDRILDLIKTGEDLEFLNYYPEFKPIFFEVQKKYVSFCNAIDYIPTLGKLLKTEFPVKKDFALFVIDKWKNLSSYFFSYYDGKLDIEKIKKECTMDIIYKGIERRKQ